MFVLGTVMVVMIRRRQKNIYENEGHTGINMATLSSTSTQRTNSYDMLDPKECEAAVCTTKMERAQSPAIHTEANACYDTLTNNSTYTTVPMFTGPRKAGTERRKAESNHYY